MRKFKALLVLLLTLGLAVLLSTVALAANTTSGTCGENVTWTLDMNTGVLTISGEGWMEDYSGGVPWYSQRESITAVVIENGVTSIGDYAFDRCSNLTSVTISNSVTSIGDSAFWGCSSLTGVTLPGSVTSIGSSAFYYCSSLTSITIPSSVTSIEDAAFASCGSLTEIKVSEHNTIYCSTDGILFAKNMTELIYYPAGKTEAFYAIPDGVSIIGDYAFFSCDSLTNVTIPSGVTYIGYAAFAYCHYLESMTIPDSVTYIGERVFGWCSCLTEILVSTENMVYGSVDGVLFNKNETELICYPAGKGTSYAIPNSVITIGNWAFEGRTNLTSITIPNSVTSIGKYAFWGCNGLTSVTIPASVTSIDDWAFIDCKNLTSITLLNAITSIGWGAFSGCTSLTDVYYSGSEAEWNEIEISSNNDYLISATIHYNSTGPEDADTSGGSSSGTDAATPGDLNGDGEVNASDLTILARHVGKVETME
ncbi:MAG: leucine-rich repeat protein, partial [Oscillospiraceae bacterium]|nr:leucine-rich repeat protein [Oscillospiraceae bacterium]